MDGAASCFKFFFFFSLTADTICLLPTEVVWLSDPRTEHLFLHKLASKQLQLFSSKPPAIKRQKTQIKENKESRLEEGPMIICVDTSGSMEGKAERIAKSLAMQIGHDHTGYEKILDRIWRI